MSPVWPLLATALFSLPAGAAPTKAPTFECTDAKKVTYRIWLGTDRNVLKVTEKGKTREIALCGPNFGRTVATGDPIVYNAWRAAGKDLYTLLDFSTEVSTQHVIEEGKTRVRLSLVVDHRERTGLACRASGVATTVVGESDETPPERRYAEKIARVAGQRTRDGTLTAVAVMQVEATVRRLAEAAGASLEIRAAFIDAVGPALKSIDARSIAQIGARLRAPVNVLWKEILAGTRYANYPEVARFAGWIRDGLQAQPRRDLASVVAGFTEFAGSRGFNDKDISSFFVKEVLPPLKDLGEDEAMQTKNSLEGDAASFFFQLWVKATGRRTVADFPAIDRITRDIASAVQSKEFDAMQVQRSLSEFVHSAMAKDEQARLMFLQAVAPLLNGLTPRQREDLMGWLEGPERALYLEMMQ